MTVVFQIFYIHVDLSGFLVYKISGLLVAYTIKTPVNKAQLNQQSIKNSTLLQYNTAKIVFD